MNHRMPEPCLEKSRGLGRSSGQSMLRSFSCADTAPGLDLETRVEKRRRTIVDKRRSRGRQGPGTSGVLDLEEMTVMVRNSRCGGFSSPLPHTHGQFSFRRRHPLMMPGKTGDHCLLVRCHGLRGKYCKRETRGGRAPMHRCRDKRRPDDFVGIRAAA